MRLTEATRPYVPKIIDPALMTSSEYIAMVNPGGKMHPSESYGVSVKKLNTYTRAEQYPQLLNTVTIKGLQFEIRQKTIDRWDQKYVKTNSSGEIVRDSNGAVQYLSHEELEQIIPEDQRYDHEYAVVDKENNMVVASTADEWGTLLIQTAEEYRNFGFGTLLVKLKRDQQPDKPSGGFTPAGLANIKRVHSAMVRDYMSSGMYSHLVNQGIITVDRAKQIIDSISATKPKPDDIDLNTNDPADWLITGDDSYILIYDRKFYDLPPQYMDTGNHWVERYVKGFVAVGGRQQFFVDRIYGDTKIRSFLIEALMNTSQEPLLLEQDQYQLIERLEPVLNTQQVEGRVNGPPRPMIQVQLTKLTVDINAMFNQEKSYRDNRDQYDEIYIRILELAESLSE